MTRIIALLLFCFAALTSVTSDAVTIRPAFSAGFEFGGDKLVDVVYADGSRSKIEAGRGLLFGGGVNLDLSETIPYTFETEATIAAKWTSTKEAANGEVDWYRFPLQLMSFYHNTEKFYRLGAGVTYQIGNELKGTKDASAVSTRFENATGYVVEADYFFGEQRNMIFGLRYTGIKYLAKAPGALAISGDSLGIAFTTIF